MFYRLVSMALQGQYPAEVIDSIGANDATGIFVFLNSTSISFEILSPLLNKTLSSATYKYPIDIFQAKPYSTTSPTTSWTS